MNHYAARALFPSPRQKRASMNNPLTVGGHSDPRVAQILDIVAAETQIRRESLLPDARIDDLGISSPDLTLAMSKLETTFDIEIPVIAGRAGAEFCTVGELISHLFAVMDRAMAMPAEA
jgi:acyl carrier protein